MYRLKCFDFLSQTALKEIKKYFKSTNEEMIMEIIMCCSNLARISIEYSREVLKSGIV